MTQLLMATILGSVVMAESDPKKGSIFDRLTDPSTFHGTHKHRFDADGKGRGLEGRDSVRKGYAIRFR